MARKISSSLTFCYWRFYLYLLISDYRIGSPNGRLQFLFTSGCHQQETNNISRIIATTRTTKRVLKSITPPSPCCPSENRLHHTQRKPYARSSIQPNCILSQYSIFSLRLVYVIITAPSLFSLNLPPSNFVNQPPEIKVLIAKERGIYSTFLGPQIFEDPEDIRAMGIPTLLTRFPEGDAG